MVTRRELTKALGQHFGGRRDLYEVMGYPRVLDVNDFVGAYERGDIAGRIIDAYPDATWRESPEIKSDSKEFLDAWSQLVYDHSIWRTFHRLDRLTNLGHYGILVLGLDGGEPLHLPAQGNDYNLLYVQPHSERTAEVIRWDSRPESPRFGKPYMYSITSGVNWTGAGAGQKVYQVHHSRVIHVAERALEDVSIGTPRLKRIWNRLMDLDKLLGGSAEMYWQNVAMLLAFLADSEADWDPAEKDEMKQQITDLQDGLQRFVRMRGVDVKQMAPGMHGSGPREHFDVQMDILAGSSGIPKRILMGSERGELSSQQDENNWQGRNAERREQFAEPEIINGFIDKGQTLGFLPKAEYDVEWAEADTLGEKGRAEVADKKAGALQKYLMSPGAASVITENEFRSWIGEQNLKPNEPELLDENDPETIVQFRGR